MVHEGVTLLGAEERKHIIEACLAWRAQPV
ncbi:hypothetical protein PMI23_00368 [Pseudomonas sp. GM24]|nr:hypothetical protein PMI19_03475 [Pseudomonas sp. GM16]EJM45661.1 hypothetical protein PMI23_00368 [Pseudomonas sp. GM24]